MIAISFCKSNPKLERRFMVCIQCRLDFADFDAIEYCIYKDFLKDWKLRDTEKNTDFISKYVPRSVKRRKVIPAEGTS